MPERLPMMYSISRMNMCAVCHQMSKTLRFKDGDANIVQIILNINGAKKVNIYTLHNRRGWCRIIGESLSGRFSLRLLEAFISKAKGLVSRFESTRLDTIQIIART